MSATDRECEAEGVYECAPFNWTSLLFMLPFAALIVVMLAGALEVL